MMPEPDDESLAVLLLPSKLEEFELGAHARGLLSIPRVVALEPPRFRTPRLMRNAVGIRQARRLPFPGRPRMIVLYHPAQYPLARALLANDNELELWYIPPDVETLAESGELRELDDLARAHATQIVPVRDGTDVSDADLRERMRELDVINARAFIPVARSRRASSRRR
jgi:peptidoglycan/xylan/chitin deacetylase (PgdA/CDA1 family)